MNCRARDTWSRQPTIRLDEESPSAEPSSNPTPRRPVVESNGACEILWSSGLTISCTTDWRNVTWRSEAKLYSSTGKGEKSSDTGPGIQPNRPAVLIGSSPFDGCRPSRAEASQFEEENDVRLINCLCDGCIASMNLIGCRDPFMLRPRPRKGRTKFSVLISRVAITFPENELN
jgi:hypothetical protein